MSLRIGFLVNPVAGLGGRVALKGSDGAAIQAEARARGGQPRGPGRVRRALVALGAPGNPVEWLSWGGPMGADLLTAAGYKHRILGQAADSSTAADTQQAARALADAGVDLLVFAGGDGTARDILNAIGDRIPVLGIPCGVKMHSGVFATTPERAGELLGRLIRGGLVSAVRREVKDLDESALRAGEIRPRRYGELTVVEPGGYLQHTKERGRENESLAITEIAADVSERLETTTLPVVLGPGGTLAEIKRTLGCPSTLLGFDVWQAGTALAHDVDARWLLDNLSEAIVVLSFTRGQGFLIGRGNQQLSPEFLRRVGRAGLWVVGTRTKLASLDGRPLLMDTDDPALDQQWSGLIEVTAGYEDRLFHLLSSHD